MKLPARVSVLFLLGIFLVGSTALGYYYYFYYAPPLKAAERFMAAMEAKNLAAVTASIVMGVSLETGDLREASEPEAQQLLGDGFDRGRILDQRKREGKSRNYYYMVYREPDGTIFALVVTSFGNEFRVVIPETGMSQRHRYLWDYTWTN